MRQSLRSAGRLAPALVLAAAGLAACGGGSGAAHHARPGNSAAASVALLRGTVATVSPGKLVLQTGTGTMTVKLTQPFRVYQREPAGLADVKDGVFIGVTTVKRPDGAEQATEIHIFPEALRGLGEGSRMMTRAPNGGSRMTNGAVAGARMTNGAAAGSRMSNGSVASASGSSLVVQYAGGSLKVVVPPGTQVTRITERPGRLTPGEQVVVPTSREPDGSLSTNKALVSGR